MVKRNRLYWRTRGGAARAYGDFRDLGGGREALIARGEQRATTDPDVAGHLIDERVQALEAKRRGRALGLMDSGVRLGRYAAEHLVKKAGTGKFNERWLAAAELHLRRACAFFGDERPLVDIGVPDVQRWLVALQALRSPGGELLSGATVRHNLNSLSNLYRRAQSEAVVPVGFNPVAALMDKPVAEPEEAHWLEVPDAALLLAAARLSRPARPDLEAPFAHPLLATFLLTGGRRAEVLGLEVADVSFDRKTVTFRRNASRRRLKSRPSHRTVPLWPQLEEILRPYADRRVVEQGGRLLFPRFEGSRELMLGDFRKLLDRVSIRAGFSEPILDREGQPVLDAKERPKLRGTLTSKMFRHTYCAARLQTLDRGAPVSTYTVSREMGHGSQDMVERVYSHLGQVRHRSEVVEYRVEQHAAVLAERLGALKGREFGTTVGTEPETLPEA